MTFTGSTPANGTTNVSRTVQATLNFSAPLDGSTVTTNNVALRDSFNANVPESLGFSGSQLSVQGAAKLLPLTPYTVNVTTGLRGTGGQVLDHAVTVGFATRDGQWQLTTTIGINTRNTRDSEIVMDPAGNAIAVWTQQTVDNTFEIWSNRYRFGIGWGTPGRIGPTGVDSNFAQVSVDAAGNAVAVWMQSAHAPNAPSNIWANRYTVNVGWGNATQIETHAGTGSATFPDVSMEPSGSALAVWVVPVGNVNRAVASRFTGGTWSAPQPIDNGAGNNGTAVVAMDANGNGTAVWTQSDGTRANVWSNRFIAGFNWGAPQLIENSDFGSAGVPRVAVDPAGNAFALWQETSGVNGKLQSNRFTPGGGWSTAQQVGAPLLNADAQIEVDTHGNAMVVWEQNNGVGRYNVFFNRFTPAGGWGTATQVETHVGTGNSFLPHVALDSSGNALAMWQQEDPSFHVNIWAARFTPAGGWGPSVRLIDNTPGTSSSGVPHLAIDARGDAVAIWSQQVGAGTFNMLSDRFE
jgi:hypothetical protein